MRPDRRALLLWSLFAVVGGAFWGLAFGREPWRFGSWIALAPLFVCLGAPFGRRGVALLGFLHGLAAWLVSIPWIAPTLMTFGQMPEWLAIFCLLLLAGYLALFHAAFALLGRHLWRAATGGAGGAWSALPALVALPALWVALEWLRTHLFGGFPWNLAAYAWVGVPGALPASAWVGAYGISFLLLFANAGVALAVVRRRTAPGGAWRWLAAGLGVPLLVLALGGRWGAGGTVPDRTSLDGGGWTHRGAPVRLLQPDIPNAVQPNWQEIRANYGRVLQMSEPACTPGSLVVWPESAAWPYSFTEDSGFGSDVRKLASMGGCTLLFNSVYPSDDGRYYNSAFVVGPDGSTARYDKRKLVPFGEYVPLAGVFSFIDKLARNAGEFRAADELGLLPWGAGEDGEGGEQLGPAICYEVTFPGQVADTVRAGATVLVTITNDAWYGDTAAPWQHYAAARFRAAENRRPLLRAAITGVSAVVERDGGEVARLDPFTQGTIRAGVRGETGLSPYTRWPWLVPVVCVFLALGGLWWGRAGGGESGRQDAAR
ncbi:MAG TPA: apolipoprotein N-acyltransferase [Thermoanaerobaculia bacterium]|nr:apolipoprotein N-acyltransferase [Thermoanaerobaculia bacterium]